jgi:hypothetical protein
MGVASGRYGRRCCFDRLGGDVQSEDAVGFDRDREQEQCSDDDYPTTPIMLWREGAQLVMSALGRRREMKAQNREVRRRHSHFANFARKDSGLVTVEWVALAAAMVIGAVTIAWLVELNVKNQSGSVGSTINGVANTTTNQAHP